ncbi:RDD family protein [Streptomyces sp. TLI_146]|uniref:RDD family protein n=1 Tax=Streptomyces sp. TLI_146 TaxID=1938858 RepID=UPI000C70DFD6|nr:RDD family protein [Streptomyces sp. TLI_146]
MSRCLASLVDVVVVAGIVLVLHLGLGGLLLLMAGPPYRFPRFPSWSAALAGWIVSLLYLAGSWTLTGGTAGGRLLGLRVTGLAGRLLGVPRALLRAALCMVFPVGLFWVPFSRRRASVQDLAVVSVVRYHRF